jgi:hypothetical protein
MCWEHVFFSMVRQSICCVSVKEMGAVCTKPDAQVKINDRPAGLCCGAAACHFMHQA